MGLLVARRTDVLVYTRCDDALSFCTAVYGAHTASARISLACGANDCMDGGSAMGSTNTRCRRTYRDILEPYAYILPRYKHGADGAREADNRRLGCVVGADNVRLDTHDEHLSRTESLQTVPAVH